MKNYIAALHPKAEKGQWGQGVSHIFTMGEPIGKTDGNLIYNKGKDILTLVIKQCQV